MYADKITAYAKKQLTKPEYRRTKQINFNTEA
jgi:excinuclease UvrABC helicase subunit UvrB